MNRTVLDSSAVLALLLAETGADRVDGVRHHAVISTVNCCEVLTRLADLGYSRKRAEARFNDLDLDVSAFTRDDAMMAAALRGPTKVAGLSLGDRACLALALREHGTVLTGDRDWSRVDVGVSVQLIR